MKHRGVLLQLLFDNLNAAGADESQRIKFALKNQITNSHTTTINTSQAIYRFALAIFREGLSAGLSVAAPFGDICLAFLTF